MDLLTKNVITDKRKKEVKRIYCEAFTPKERMPFPLMIAMSCLWHTEFLSFYDGDTLCGLIYLATIGRQTFIMFFAVDESLRSKGYGSRILDAVARKHPKNTIIVSIEPCDEAVDDIAQRLRRKKFYQRNGYTDAGYDMKLSGIRQEVLFRGPAFRRGAFIRFFMLYSNLTVIPKIWKRTDAASPAEK